jgi:hypothetical protein
LTDPMAAHADVPPSAVRPGRVSDRHHVEEKIRETEQYGA